MIQYFVIMRFIFHYSQYVYEYESVDPTYEYKMCHFLHSGTVSCYKKHLSLNNTKKDEGNTHK